MGLLNSVPRESYDLVVAQLAASEARYATLFAAYEKLRPTHSASAPIRVTAPREEPGLATLHIAEAIINNPRLAAIADNLQRTNPELSRVEAVREAKRLDDIARGRAVAPSVASPPEPPGR